MNRSQRCGVCSGCQAKPCGQCVYCQDSPQFGGPGVKKQSCLERRCHRVLENRLQRDAPTFKAKAGCNQCDDCRSVPDCQVCLVCLDKKFFQNRYLPNAMCAKKRCNQSRAIELPASLYPTASGVLTNGHHRNPHEMATADPHHPYNSVYSGMFDRSNVSFILFVFNIYSYCQIPPNCGIFSVNSPKTNIYTMFVFVFFVLNMPHFSE